jgi:ABC-2 type transport system ATP-binding protein
MEAARRLSHAGVAAEDIEVRRPTLDDVFLSLTGQAPAEADETTTNRELVAA